MAQLNIPQKPIDWLAYDRWTGSDASFARSLGMDPNNFAQYKRRHLRQLREQVSIEDVPLETVDLTPTSNGSPTTTLQRVEFIGEPVSADDRDSTADLKAQLDTLAAEVADLKAHRLEVDAWIAIQHTRPIETAQPHAALRSAETRRLAQDYAEPAHTWDDPEDAKSVPFNLSLPRGLKRLLDAEAKRTGFPASRLVQQLLMADLVGGGDASDA